MARANLTLSKDTQESLVRLSRRIQEKQRENSTFIDRLRNIDLAYAKQKIELEDKDTTCLTPADNSVLKVPVVASEVDTVAAELISNFAAHYPLFGVLPDNGNPEAAMQFQALLTRDARYQRWGRQIALFCSNAARYNVAGLEVDKIWQKDTKVTTTENLDTSFDNILYAVSNLKAIDMYNALFDYRVPPADLATEGDYVGYNEIYTRSRLKTLGNTLSEKGYVYNAAEVYRSSLQDIGSYWNMRPDISTMRSLKPEESDTWFNWLGILEDEKRIKLQSDAYFVTKLYVRIIPSEFGISSSAKPIIAQILVVNDRYLFSYKEIVTPLDVLPIPFCDLREDGFGYQTHSVGENVKAYQDVATELLDIRIQGSKRALNDRAIYDSEYLDPVNVNASVSAPKIPMKTKLRNSGERPRPSDLYYAIPFDSSSTVSALQDMSTILALKDDINGVNFARRGEQRPGNRTLGEFDQLRAAGSSKTVPYMLRLEEQVFIYIKLLVKINILSNALDVQTVYDALTEKSIEVDMAKLRKSMLEFRLTDGLRPKSALRDPNMLSTAIQAVQNSPELNQEYSVSGIFADLLAVVDIDISRHKREVINNGSNTGIPTGGLPAPPTNQGEPPAA